MLSSIATSDAAALAQPRAIAKLINQTLDELEPQYKANPDAWAGILNAGSETPILEVATKGGFIYLADDAPREVVVGTVVAAPPGTRGKLTAQRFKEPFPPGFATAAMNFATAGLKPCATSDPPGPPALPAPPGPPTAAAISRAARSMALGFIGRR